MERVMLFGGPKNGWRYEIPINQDVINRIELVEEPSGIKHVYKRQGKSSVFVYLGRQPGVESTGPCPECLGADGKHTSRCSQWRG